MTTPLGSATLAGVVPAGHYVTYEGQGEALVCDGNWNEIARLPLEGEGLRVPTGEGQLEVSQEGAGDRPWLRLGARFAGPSFRAEGPPLQP